MLDQAIPSEQILYTVFIENLYVLKTKGCILEMSKPRWKLYLIF